MSQNEFKEEEFNTESLDISLWKQILKMLWERRNLLYWLLFFNFVVTVAEVIFPLMNRYAIDVFVVDQNTSTLTTFIIIDLILVIITAVAVYGFIRMGGKIENAFAYDVRKKAFNKLQELSFSYFDKTPSGWIIARMTSDISRLSEVVSWGVFDICYGLMMMSFISVIMFVTNWKLAILALVIVPFMFIIANYFQKRILIQYRDVRKINSQITGAFSEGISGAKTTKTMVLEEYHAREFKDLTSSMRQKSIKAAYFNALFFPIILTLGSVSTALLLWQGGQSVLMKTIEFGTLVMFIQYSRQFFDPVFMISGWLAELQMAQASAERVLQLLNTESQIVDREEVIAEYGTVLEPKPEAYPSIEGNVEFEDVTFYYNEDEPVLTNFDLKVKAGERIALVGETGSGKSTIVNLICRFYEPVKGSVKIDGVDYRDRSIGWLHANLGYVLQAPHLFSGTIMENIRFGRLDATDEEIIEAAKTVNAYDFIMEMDQGFESEVGEGGGRLSTGQKQLISFARAILANPAIFVLDEATSSIDTETEQIIQHAIENLMFGKTSFIIAHRLSTIVDCDRILVIKKGQIVEEGTHQTLLDLRGYYYRLYTNQYQEDQTSDLLKINDFQSE